MGLLSNPPRAGEPVNQLWKSVFDLDRRAASRLEADRMKLRLEDVDQIARRSLFAAEGSARVKRYVISLVLGDYLQCRECDDAGAALASASIVLVAKPLPLRTSHFSGKTVGIWNYQPYFNHLSSRTGSIVAGTAGFGSNAVFSEELSKNYVVGDSDIYAVEALTGVNGASWLDLNVSARHWQPILTEVKVCVSSGSTNVLRRMAIHGGPMYP